MIIINKYSCRNHISSNQLLLKMQAFLTAPPLYFSVPLVVASVHLAAKSAKVFSFSTNFYFHATFQCHFLHNFFVRDDPDLQSFQLFLVQVFNPRDQYYRVCRQIIIIIISITLTFSQPTTGFVFPLGYIHLLLRLHYVADQGRSYGRFRQNRNISGRSNEGKCLSFRHTYSLITN